jgi:quercetin dioxygenase-like cupin family protein
LVERLLDDASLTRLELRAGDVGPAMDAAAPTTTRGLASDDLNATLLSWTAGSGPPEHVNDERDVLVVVLDGSATLTIDDEEHELARGETAIVAKGRSRKITAGGDGVRYLSVHRRRPPLQIAGAAAADPTSGR